MNKRCLNNFFFVSGHFGFYGHIYYCGTLKIKKSNVFASFFVFDIDDNVENFFSVTYALYVEVFDECVKNVNILNCVVFYFIVWHRDKCRSAMKETNHLRGINNKDIVWSIGKPVQVYGKKYETRTQDPFTWSDSNSHVSNANIQAWV